jgi:hypothetical protein
MRKWIWVKLRTSISSTTALFFFYRSEAGRLDIYMPEKLQASDRMNTEKGRKKYWRTSKFHIQNFQIEQTLLHIPGLE